WRYKAFMPLIAALPLVYLAREHALRTAISLPLIGVIDFGDAYYFLVIPLMVMVVTNVVNMLGGLNGLETIGPAIILIGLMVLAPFSYMLLMLGPLIFWLVLAAFNFKGKIFVGNSGSFAIGMTVASFAIIADLKSSLLISIIPYVFNSALILLSVFLFGKKANVSLDGNKLVSTHRRSLITLITYQRPMTERKVVALIALLVACFVSFAVLTELLC
ncbi:MAG: hypothetical protein QXV09_02485, partial [Candidatus Bathyarchaeia archaeon]